MAHEPLVEELEAYRSQVDRIRQDAGQLTAGLSDAQFNWRPGPGRWSIAECFSHLTIAGHLYFPPIDRAIDRARAEGWFSRGPFRHPWLGNRFIRMAEPPVGMKLRAPKPFRPVPDQPVAKLVPEFMTVQDGILERIERSNGLDLARARMTSPVSRLFRQTLGQAFAIVLAHERRHLWQARNVRQTPGFPNS